MKFTHTFGVPANVETTFAALVDLERVAPCLPGATLEEVDGDTYTGRVKVKLGPISVTYRGTARLAEVDEAAHTARIEAAGKEARGAGTASADVHATLAEADSGTEVKVVTDLTITGKPAQFGQGVMADVGTRIIDTFADRLETMLITGERPAGAPGPEASAAGAVDLAERLSGGDAVSDAVTGEAAALAASTNAPRRIPADPARADDALDMMQMAGGAAAKRLVPALGALAVLVGLFWWWRRR